MLHSPCVTRQDSSLTDWVVKAKTRFESPSSERLGSGDLLLSGGYPLFCDNEKTAYFGSVQRDDGVSCVSLYARERCGGNMDEGTLAKKA